MATTIDETEVSKPKNQEVSQPQPQPFNDGGDNLNAPPGEVDAASLFRPETGMQDVPRFEAGNATARELYEKGGFATPREVVITDANNQQHSGRQWSDSQGRTFFLDKTSGHRYEVVGDGNGGYKLNPTRNDSPPIEARTLRLAGDPTERTMTGNTGTGDLGQRPGNGRSEVAPRVEAEPPRNPRAEVIPPVVEPGGAVREAVVPAVVEGGQVLGKIEERRARQFDSFVGELQGDLQNNRDKAERQLVNRFGTENFTQAQIDRLREVGVSEQTLARFQPKPETVVAADTPVVSGQVGARPMVEPTGVADTATVVRNQAGATVAIEPGKEQPGGNKGGRDQAQLDAYLGGGLQRDLDRNKTGRVENQLTNIFRDTPPTAEQLNALRQAGVSQQVLDRVVQRTTPDASGQVGGRQVEAAPPRAETVVPQRAEVPVRPTNPSDAGNNNGNNNGNGRPPFRNAEELARAWREDPQSVAKMIQRGELTQKDLRALTSEMPADARNRLAESFKALDPRPGDRGGEPRPGDRGGEHRPGDRGGEQRGGDKQAQTLRDVVPQNVVDRMPPHLRQMLEEQFAKNRELKAGDKGGQDRPDGARIGGKELSDQLGKITDAAKSAQGQQIKIPGLDMSDRANREFLQDAIKRLQEAKGQSISDALKGLDPARVARLEKFLTEDGKVRRTDDVNIAQLKSILTGRDQMQRPPVERLADFITRNKELFTNNDQALTKANKQAITELSQILKDLNKQMTLDGKPTVTAADLLGRTLDFRRPIDRMIAMETGMLTRSMNDKGDLAQTMRIMTNQDAAMRAIMDARANQAGLNSALAAALAAGRLGDGRAAVTPGQQIALAGKGDAVVPGAAARADIAAGQAQFGRVDPAALVRGTELGARSDAISAKADANIGGKPIEGVRADLGVRADGFGPRIDDPLALNAKLGEARLDKVDPRSTERKLEEEQRKLKEKEKKEKEDEQKELDDKKRLEALMLAALADKRRKKLEEEQKEKEKSEEKDKQRDREKRRKYMVREKDTLQSIAAQQLRDVRLAPLIYEINKEVIQLKEEKGKKVVDLKPKQIIWLPSTAEIEDFRKGALSGSSRAALGGKPAGGASATPGVTADGRKMTAEEELTARFGAGWAGSAGSAGAADDVTSDLMESALAASQKRKENIEKLLGPIGKQRPADGRIRYICRLGDTLKSIAIKHPALGDVSLWKLIAQVNNLSTDVDHKGVPVAAISRGATLLIPSAEEIDQFKLGSGALPSAVKTTRDQDAIKTAGAEETVNDAASSVVTSVDSADDAGDSDKSPRAAGASGKPAQSGESVGPDGPEDEDISVPASRYVAPGVPPSAPPPPDSAAIIIEDGDSTAVLKVASDSIDCAPASAERAPVETVLLRDVDFDEESAEKTIEDLSENCRLVKFNGEGFVTRIELLREDKWVPVVTYEIFDDVSMRHEHLPEGRKRSVRIDLPPAAATELASNDLTANWQQYCSKFDKAPKQVDTKGTSPD